MFELIARLRTKSVAHRRRVALTTAALVTGVIVLMWVVWLAQGGFSSRFNHATSTPEATPATSLWTPLANMFRSVGKGFDILKKL